MLDLPLFLPFAQATEPWLTTWLTPIWFLGMGIGLGLVGLAILVVLFRILSAISPWQNLSKSVAGHVVAAVISAALAGGIWIFGFDQEIMGDAELNEPVLLGISLFLLCAIVGWSLVFCCAKQPAKAAIGTLTEGVSGYLGTMAVILVAVAGTIWGLGYVGFKPIVPDPIGAFTSIPKVFFTGKAEVVAKIPAAPVDGEAPFTPVKLDINFELLESLSITSDRTVNLADSDDPLKFVRVPERLGATEAAVWNNKMPIEVMPIPYEDGSMLHIQNTEIDEATVVISTNTSAPVPEASTLVITAISVMLIGMTLLLQQAVAPRASAVAHATVKNELAQPLFLVLMLLGTLAVILYSFLSFNTFGEDIKLLKECGITTIMLLAAFQGIWSASSSVSEEIEGKTALTVLSKPIQRRSFVIGKFLGIFWVLMLMFVVLGSFELIAVAYKPIYDSKEASGANPPTWSSCHLEMISTIPGLAMAFMQSVVLTAISVALATRLPQLANLAVCVAIYVVGNLTTSLVSSTQEGFEIVRFVASLIATIVPILEHFSLQAAIDSGNQITMSLLSGSLIYCLLYVLVSMFLALLLFEDRDLA